MIEERGAMAPYDGFKVNPVLYWFQGMVDGGDNVGASIPSNHFPSS